MLTRQLRLGMKRPEGQALVVACLMVLVLSLAVLTTATLGHTVHERVRLQNNADAAAYSMAAMEARAFNFYAFANRTQASHYVSAMVWQSLDSFIYFSEAFLTDAYALVKTVVPCATANNPLCLALSLVPGIAETLELLRGIMDLFKGFVQGVQTALRNTPIDRFIGRVVVPGHRTLNGVMAAASTAVMRATLSHVTSTSQHILAANDPNLDPALASAATGPLNACIFDRAHFLEANGSPLQPNLQPFRALDPEAREEDSKVSRAKRAMGAVSNATRHACDTATGNCPSTFTTSRTFEDLNFLQMPASLDIVRSVFSITKLGQSRMLTYKAYARDAARNGDHATEEGKYGTNQMRWLTNTPDSPTGPLAQGDVLGSDDLYSLSPVPAFVPAPIREAVETVLGCGPKGDWEKCHGDPRRNESYMFETSIFAMSDVDADRAGLPPGGVHWRMAYPGNAPDPDDAQMGINRRSFALVFGIYTANVRPLSDGNHPWEGVVPFPHFEPGQFEEACDNVAERGADPSLALAAMRSDERGEEFNQPSAWILLNKSPERMRNPLADPTATRAGPALLNEGGTLTFRFADGTTLELDNTRRALLGYAQGINALSRAQTYYHRPGNWTEPPNFFNPYWRPRLASVHQGRGSFPMVVDLIDSFPEPLQRAPQKVITH